MMEADKSAIIRINLRIVEVSRRGEGILSGGQV